MNSRTLVEYLYIHALHPSFLLDQVYISPSGSSSVHVCRGANLTATAREISERGCEERPEVSLDSISRPTTWFTWKG